MAQYSTVSDLYTDVQKYVDRNESTFINKIPSWVFMAESELDRRLRHPAAENIQSFTVQKGSDYLTAPIDLLELKSIRNSKSGEFLYRRSLETLYTTPNYGDTPIAFASTSNRYVLDQTVTEDTVFSVVYYNAPTKLDITNSSNLYLVSLPDFLLYVSLELAYIFDGQPEQAQYWRGMAEAVFAMLQEQILRESYQGSTLVTHSNSDNISRYY